MSKKPHRHSILQVPTTHLAKMSIDPKSSELVAADVLGIILQNVFKVVFFGGDFALTPHVRSLEIS